MPDIDLADPPADPEAFKGWRDAARRQLEREKAEIERERSQLARQPGSRPQPFLVPALIALTAALVAYLALSVRSSIDAIDKRTVKIENAMGNVPAAEPPATAPKPETTKPEATRPETIKPETAASPDARLADSLNDIKEQVTATRSEVDALRRSIVDLERFANKAKDPAPAGFASDEMLVAQKGLLVKTPGASGTQKWLATPSHDMLDLLLKIPQGKSFRVLAFAPKRDDQVKAVDVYDRNNKAEAGRAAACQAENKTMRCKLNVRGPTVLQVIAKTKGDEPLNIELE